MAKGKRGPYKSKKATPLSTSPDPKPEIQVKKSDPMNEIDFLAIFVDTFESFDEHTKHRIGEYLGSRYDIFFRK
jgi:hypothetical protein